MHCTSTCFPHIPQNSCQCQCGLAAGAGASASPARRLPCTAVTVLCVRTMLAASGEVLATMDASLAGFFGSLSPTELNHTAFVVLGDHGLHMGLSFLYTRSGKV